MQERRQSSKSFVSKISMYRIMLFQVPPALVGDTFPCEGPVLAESILGCAAMIGNGNEVNCPADCDGMLGACVLLRPAGCESGGRDHANQDNFPGAVFHHSGY